MNALFDFLKFLAPFKTERSSVLHVFRHRVEWPKAGTLLVIRETHWFEPPTFHEVLVPC